MNLRIAALAAAFMLAGTAIAFAADPTIKFTLHPQNHSGETADVVMTQTSDGLVVTVTTQNAPADTLQPVHIHPGSCEKLDPKPIYPLTTLKGGTSTTTLKTVNLQQLQMGDFAINIHHSTSDVPTYYACGNIPKMSMMKGM